MCCSKFQPGIAFLRQCDRFSNLEGGTTAGYQSSWYRLFPRKKIKLKFSPIKKKFKQKDKKDEGRRQPIPRWDALRTREHLFLLFNDLRWPSHCLLLFGHVWYHCDFLKWMENLVG